MQLDSTEDYLQLALASKRHAASLLSAHAIKRYLVARYQEDALYYLLRRTVDHPIFEQVLRLLLQQPGALTIPTAISTESLQLCLNLLRNDTKREKLYVDILHAVHSQNADADALHALRDQVLARAAKQVLRCQQTVLMRALIDEHQMPIELVCNGVGWYRDLILMDKVDTMAFMLERGALIGEAVCALCEECRVNSR